MSRQFARAKPLQAGKLATITAVLLFAAGATFGLIPRGLDALLFTTVFSLGLTLVIVAETLRAGFRALRTDEPLGRRFADRPVYTAVRAGEAVIAILASSAFVVSFSVFTPVAGPGAIGLLFVGVALGLLILGASLVRTLTEYYYHRRTDAA